MSFQLLLWPFRPVAAGLVLVLGLAAGLPRVALAQTFGTVTGAVTEAGSSAPLAGARLAIAGTTLEVYSARDGSYTFPAVPSGEIELQASFLGRGSQTLKVRVVAGRPAVQDFALGADIVRMSAFTVEGAAGAQAKALNVQRAALNVTNEVAADTMGRLPDSNVAEALKRISAVSLVVNQQTGEGETVAVRGLSSGLNVYTVNGVRAATANTGNRDVSLNTMTTEGLQGVTVAKTLTPEYDADAIGGTIDLRTPTGFDFGRRTVRASASMGYNTFAREFNPAFTAGFADVVAGGRLGIYLGAGYDRKQTLAEEVANGGSSQWEPYRYFPTTSVFVDPDTFQMQGVELDRFEDRIERKSVNGSVDWKSGDALKLHLRIQHSAYRQSDNFDTMVVRMQPEPLGFGTLVQTVPTDGTLPQPRIVGVDPTKGNVYQYGPGQVVDQDRDGQITDRDRRNAANNGPARVTGGRGATDGLYSLGGASGVWDPRAFLVTRSLAYREFESASTQIDLGGSLRLGDYRLDGNASYSRARKDTPVSASLGFTSANTAPFTTTRLSFTNPEPDRPAWHLPAAAAAAVYDESLFEFTGAGATQTWATNTMTLLQANLRRDFRAGGLPAFVKLGGKFRRDTRDIDVNTLASPTRRAIRLAGASDLVAFRESSLLGTYHYGPIGNGPALTRAILGGDPKLFSASPEVAALTNLRSDRTGREDVAAGYLMAGLTVRRWEFLAGARAEGTRVENSVWRTGRLNPAVATAQSRYEAATGTSGFADTRASYSNVTPSAHLSYRHNERMVFRAAAWNSISRPEYRYLEAGETYNFNANGEITSITRGNPALKPAEARNFDLGFEYYTRDGGLFSLGVYHKRIRNFILGDNGESEAVVGAVDNLPVPVTQPKNGSAAEITGVELTFQQQLRTLPAPFDGLGVAMNLTLQTSAAETGIPFRQGRRVEFMNSPEQLWNAALFYEKAGWEARLAASFNGAYIEDLRAHAVDKWIQARTQYDFKLSRRIGAGWRGYFEIQNLTNEPVYWATHGRKITNVKDYTEVGTSFIAGVSWTR
jgi:TonB-dependent receptor